MRRDDVLVVWRLDTLGRNLYDLLGFVNVLKAQSVQPVSLTEQMDTKTTMGRLVFQMFGALAEYERGLIREWAEAGASARARGCQGGRPRVVTEDKLQTAQALMQEKTVPISHICQTLGVSRNSLYRYLTPERQLRQKADSRPC